MRNLYKRILNFIKKRPNLFIFAALALVVFASYGLTLKMYWWVDDWGLLFKMIHPESAPGNLGAGIWGEGAYRFLATPFIFLYPTLGLEATPYFMLGFLQYLILSFLVYLLVKKILGDFGTSFGAALIFASGYMGSYALYRLSNSYQLTDTAILMILTVYALIHYFQTKKLRFYILSLILYTSTIEFLFLRAHGIVFVVAAAFFLFAERRLNLKNILKNFIKFIPFLFIYSYFYVFVYLIGQGSNNAGSLGLVNEFIKVVIKERHLEMIGNFFANFFNLIVPYDFSRTVYMEVLRMRSLNFDNFLGLMGILIFSLVFLFWLFLLVIKRRNSKLILFGSVWLIANYISYYLYNPAANLFSTTRYLIPSFVGSSILFSAVLHELGILGGSAKGVKRLLGLTFIGLIVFSFISLTRKEEKAIIGYATIPTKQAYEAVRKTVSKVDEKSLFFFELEDNAPFKAHLLGGMGYLGISVFFNYNGETKIADTYDEVFNLLSSGKASIDNLYGFYGSTKEGFTSFTEKFRKLLIAGGSEKKLLGWSSRTGKEQLGSGIVTETKLVKTKEGGMVGVNPSLEVEPNYDSMVPSELTLTMKISPSAMPLEFPFRDVTTSFAASESFDSLVDYKPVNERRVDKLEVIRAIREEQEKQEFLRTSKVTASSSWKDREAVHLNDGNPDTNWNAHIAVWNAGKRPEKILIDLGRVKTVSKLIWINSRSVRTPTSYTISFSNDGENWFNETSGVNTTKRGDLETITEKFSPTSARFLKMSIYDTFSGTSPAIAELWTSSLTGGFNALMFKEIADCPLCFVSDLYVYKELAYYVNKTAVARLWWSTNRNENYSLTYSNSFPIYVDGRTHTYNLIIPAQGTVLKRLKIDGFAMPVRVVIEKAKIRSLSLPEIKNKGLIHELGGEDIRL